MASASDREVHVRRRNPERAEESFGEQLVVVLARVHDDLLDPGAHTGPVHRCKLGEVRACAHDVQQLHLAGVSRSSFGVSRVMRSRNSFHHANRFAISFSKPNGPGW